MAHGLIDGDLGGGIVKKRVRANISPRELDALRGDFWIRLLYTHPAHWTDELIETMAEESAAMLLERLPQVLRTVIVGERDFVAAPFVPLAHETLRRLDLFARLRDCDAHLCQVYGWRRAPLKRTTVLRGISEVPE